MSNQFVRLVTPGFANLTGMFGAIQFADGVSVREVSEREVDFLSACTRIESVSGDELGAAHRIVGGATLPAEIMEPLPRQTEAERAAEIEAEKGVNLPAVSEIPHYSDEDLNKVADEKGIAGLRAIAQPRGVKGRSIPDLIAEIMREQGEREQAAEAAAQPDAPTPPVEEPEQKEFSEEHDMRTQPDFDTLEEEAEFLEEDEEHSDASHQGPTTEADNHQNPNRFPPAAPASSETSVDELDVNPDNAAAEKGE